MVNKVTIQSERCESEMDNRLRNVRACPREKIDRASQLVDEAEKIRRGSGNCNDLASPNLERSRPQCHQGAVVVVIVVYRTQRS